MQDVMCRLQKLPLATKPSGGAIDIYADSSPTQWALEGNIIVRKERETFDFLKAFSEWVIANTLTTSVQCTTKLCDEDYSDYSGRDFEGVITLEASGGKTCDVKFTVSVNADRDYYFTVTNFRIEIGNSTFDVAEDFDEDVLSALLNAKLE